MIAVEASERNNHDFSLLLEKVMQGAGLLTLDSLSDTSAILLLKHDTILTYDEARLLDISGKDEFWLGNYQSAFISRTAASKEFIRRGKNIEAMYSFLGAYEAAAKLGLSDTATLCLREAVRKFGEVSIYEDRRFPVPDKILSVVGLSNKRSKESISLDNCEEEMQKLNTYTGTVSFLNSDVRSLFYKRGNPARGYNLSDAALDFALDGNK